MSAKHPKADIGERANEVAEMPFPGNLSSFQNRDLMQGAVEEVSLRPIRASPTEFLRP